MRSSGSFVIPIVGIRLWKNENFSNGLSFFVLRSGLDRYSEDNPADDKEHSNHAHTGADIAGNLGDDADNGRAHKGGALAADIHQTKIFARLFWGDNLRKPGAGEGLNAALEHPNTDRQEPEVGLFGHKHRKDGDAEIGDDTDGYQLVPSKFFGQPAKENGKGEGHNLGHQQRQQ